MLASCTVEHEDRARGQKKESKQNQIFSTLHDKLLLPGDSEKGLPSSRHLGVLSFRLRSDEGQCHQGLLKGDLSLRIPLLNIKCTAKKELSYIYWGWQYGTHGSHASTEEFPGAHKGSFTLSSVLESSAWKNHSLVDNRIGCDVCLASGECVMPTTVYLFCKCTHKPKRVGDPYTA